MTCSIKIANMAKIVWAFDIKPGPGPVDDDVATGFSGGLLIAPNKFPLRFTPRSAAHIDAIEKGFSVASAYLSKFG
jgi:hypothetical protein